MLLSPSTVWNSGSRLVVLQVLQHSFVSVKRKKTALEASVSNAELPRIHELIGPVDV